MKNKYTHFICLFTTLLVLTTTPSCYKQEGELITTLPDPELLIQLYQPGSPVSNEEDANQLQFSIQKDGYQFASFGQFDDQQLPDIPRTFYFADAQQEQEAVVLVDNQGIPAFIYSVDLSLGMKSESLTEFEPISPGKFYWRFYHYDWTNRIGTLLFETIITRDRIDFTGAATFETKNLALSGVKSGDKKRKLHKTPIARLDNLLEDSELRPRGAFLENLENSFNNFSVSDIVNFSTSHLRKVQVAGGIAAAMQAYGLSGAAAASAVGTTLLPAVTAVGVVAVVIEVTLKHDRIGQHLQELKEKFTDFGKTVSHTAEARIETIRGYNESLENTWNGLTQNFPSLEDMLAFIKEEEVLIPDVDLDDLPDSEGVIHIALSWNTNRTDVDLWVTDSNGEKIYFDHETSASGGYLDRDDVDGYGPENIYWRKNAPDGAYRVEVHYFGCESASGACPSTYAKVKISNGLGFVLTKDLTLDDVDDVVLATTFTKVGTEIQ